MRLWLVPLSILILFELVADIFAKEYSLRGGAILWILAIASYVARNAFFLIALRNGAGIARAAILFSVGSALLATILGLYFYHEQTNRLQIIGMLFGILSLVLIFWE